MKDKDFFNLKFLNRHYVKHKENEIKRLDSLKIKITQELENEKLINEQSKIELEKLNSENLQLKFYYNNMKNTFINKGIVLDVENNNFNIKEWDNLYLQRKGDKLFIANKKGEAIYSLDKNISIILSDILKDGYYCSIIVIRKSSKYIKTQVRFYKKEE